MNTLSYTDFTEKVHSNTSRKRIPLDASIDLTYRCNNKCVHCYCNLPENDVQAIKEELSTIEVKKLLDDLASIGSLWLLITGGDPLLRTDFEEIYLDAKKKGFIITLFTNGTLIDDKTVEFLSKYPPFTVEISIYGATRETYEKVTRVKGSYERCMNGIKRIVDSGIKLKLKSMALTINQHEIEAMDKMAQAFGCEFKFDPMLNKRIDDNTFSDPVKYRISPEDVVKLDKAHPKRMEEWRQFCEKFVGKPIKDDRLFKCGAGLGMIHSDPYGIAKGCMMMAKDGFSVREHDLKWIWDEGILSAITRKKDFPMPCDACQLVNLCGQCAAWSIIESGDLKKEVAYLCDIAKIRSRDFEFIKSDLREKEYEKEEMVKT
jgi:radical SAM protein with 4Fe4S-binding SPASM domain